MSTLSPREPNDWIFEHLGNSAQNIEMPNTFSLLHLVKGTKNQGLRGTCAAFAGVTVLEIQLMRDQGQSTTLSPEFIYYHRYNKPSTGMCGKNVFQIMQSIGNVPEAIYPYCIDDGVIAPTREMISIAKHYKISQFARVITINGLRRALLEIGACFMLLPQYDNSNTFWINKELTSSNNASKDGSNDASMNNASMSYHAVTVVGYDTEGFIIKNSWGTSYGNDGVFIFPYVDWDCHLECWVTMTNPQKVKTESAWKRFRHYLNNLRQARITE